MFHDRYCRHLSLYSNECAPHFNTDLWTGSAFTGNLDTHTFHIMWVHAAKWFTFNLDRRIHLASNGRASILQGTTWGDSSVSKLKRTLITLANALFNFLTKLPLQRLPSTTFTKPKQIWSPPRIFEFFSQPVSNGQRAAGAGFLKHLHKAANKFK